MTINIKYQQGMTLMELLVAGLISLIASSAMIMLMANTLGTGARTIKATRLGDEMRSSMQFITRELRRANYHSTFAACFGAPNCTATLDIDDYIYSVSNPVTGLPDTSKGIGIVNSNDCLWFWYDRNSDGVLSNEPVAAFRLVQNDADVGIIQMTITRTDSAEGICAADWDNTAWVDITDSQFVDVTAFEVDNTVEGNDKYDPSILEAFLEAGAIDSYPFTLSESIQAIDRIGIRMTGSVIDNASPSWLQNAPPTVDLQDFILVRNGVVSSAP